AIWFAQLTMERSGKAQLQAMNTCTTWSRRGVNDQGVATWVETCFCDPPLAEERPYWQEYFQLLSVKDAHSRRTCRHENRTEPWACCDCDCTKKLKEWLATRGASFLEDPKR